MRNDLFIYQTITQNLKDFEPKDIAEKSSILSRPWFKSLVGPIERNLQTKVDCEPSQNIMQCIKFCLWMFDDKALKSAMSTQHLVSIQYNWIYQHKMALEQSQFGLLVNHSKTWHHANNIFVHMSRIDLKSLYFN